MKAVYPHLAKSEVLYLRFSVIFADYLKSYSELLGIKIPSFLFHRPLLCCIAVKSYIISAGLKSGGSRPTIR